MSKKILVVYYSRTGNTERVAKDVASRLNADIERIVDKKDRAGFTGYMGGGRDAMKKYLTEIGPMEKNPADYDIVVIGTPIWAWKMTPAVRTYIENNKDKFKSIACFTTAGGSKEDKVIASMEELSGKKSVAATGLVSKDLKKDNLYNDKLSAFVAAIQQK